MNLKRFRVLCLWVLLTVLLFCALPASAGYNPLKVATDGKGIAVYTTSGGKKQAGILYNGFGSSLSLDDTNGLYSCGLTEDYTVWLNQDKAEKYTGQTLCDIFLAEVIREDAEIYTTPGHKHLSARHAPGTLVLVCGEFGDDYYVDLRSMTGFMPKAALRRVKSLSCQDAVSFTWGVDGAAAYTVYTGGGVLMRRGSATGYCDADAGWQIKDGSTVTVLAFVGDMAQLAGGGFIESRFLDPDGDHSRTYAYVTSDEVLNRLNVRAYASKDASVVCKLCSGAQVQIIDRTEDWACVLITGENGGAVYSGCVQTQYLSMDAPGAKDGRTAVRTLYLLGGGNGGNYYRVSWSGRDGTLPAETDLTVIGTEGHYDADYDNPDRLIAMTADGRLIVIYDDGVLEVTGGAGISVKTASDVRMRAAPNKTADVLTSLSKGTKVEVLLRGEGWTQVRYKNQVGYVMSRYLKFP